MKHDGGKSNKSSYDDKKSDMHWMRGNELVTELIKCPISMPDLHVKSVTVPLPVVREANLEYSVK